MLDERRIKEMMHDAEEEVPSRVWSVVSSRLDATASQSPSPVWKWAGAAIAFAAFAAGLFFVGTSDRSREVTAPVQIAETVEISIPEISVAPKQEKGLLAEAVIPIMPAPSPVPRKTIVADSSVAEPASAIDVTAEPTAPEKAAPSERESSVQTDPFAALEEEKTADIPVSRIQMTLNGSMGGNSSKGLGASTMSGGTPVAPSSDVISETSNSSFGIPFTVGLGVRFNVASRLYIGTGLDYSLLTRTFDGTFTAAGSSTHENGSVRNNQHYIGIPVKLYYSVIENQSIKFYAYGGGEFEWCISNKFEFRPSAGGESIIKHYSVDSPQFSVGAGVGVQFSLTEKFGIFLDPGVNYYFYGSQPKSIRTARPFMFNFNAGFRFDL